jgi:hypothetical protein
MWDGTCINDYCALVSILECREVMMCRIPRKQPKTPFVHISCLMGCHLEEAIWDSVHQHLNKLVLEAPATLHHSSDSIIST